MKHLLSLLPIVVCGCIYTTSEPRTSTDPGDAGYFVTWSTVDMRGVAGDCKAVADVVRVTSNDALTGQAAVHNFDCRATTGDIGAVVGAGSTVRVELVDCGGSFCLEGGSPVGSFSVDTTPPAANGGRVGLGPFAFDAL